MTRVYTVLVSLSAKPGKASELKQLLSDVCEPSRNEATCIAYKLHQDIIDTNKFMLYEQWESKAAHELQFQKPYIIALGEKIASLLAGPYQVTYSEEINEP